jgi:hypothetical protein
MERQRDPDRRLNRKRDDMSEIYDLDAALAEFPIAQNF